MLNTAELADVYSLSLSASRAAAPGRRMPTATLWFAWMHAEAGVSTPVHTHDCETVALLLSGRARCRVGPALSEVVDMEPGDVLYMPAGVVHLEETLGDEPAEFYVARNNHGGGAPTIVEALNAPEESVSTTPAGATPGTSTVS